MKKTITSILPVLLLISASLFSTSANAIQFELGGSFSTVLARISEDDADNSDAVAVTASKASIVPYFSLVGNETYFSEDTNFGWTYQIWGSTFIVDQQEIDSKFSDDFNTELKGTYFYALPLVYYRFGDRLSTKRVRGWRITLGVGYGVSYTNISGDIKLTTKSEDADTAEVKDVSANGWYYSVGILLKASWESVFFSITNNSPQIKDEDHIYRIHNVSYTLGYEFAFDFEIGDLF